MTLMLRRMMSTWCKSLQAGETAQPTSSSAQLQNIANTHIADGKYTHRRRQIHTLQTTNTHLVDSKYTHGRQQIQKWHTANTHMAHGKYTHKTLQIHRQHNKCCTNSIEQMRQNAIMKVKYMIYACTVICQICIH